MTVSFSEGIKICVSNGFEIPSDSGDYAGCIGLIEYLKSEGKVDYQAIGLAFGLGSSGKSASRVLLNYRRDKLPGTERDLITARIVEIVALAVEVSDSDSVEVEAVDSEVDGSSDSEVTLETLLSAVGSLRSELAITLGSLRGSLEDLVRRVKRIEDHLFEQ